MKLYLLAGKCLVLAIMSASWFFWGTMQVLAVSYVTSQIDQIDNAFSGSIDINNRGQIVYGISGFEGNYLYFHSQGINIKIGSGSSPSINDNAEIVYRDFDGNDVEIYLYNNGSSKKITDNNYDDGYPDINNSGSIVWAGRYSPNYKIYFYNGSNIQEIATVSPSTGETDYDGGPNINDSGQIVWDSFDGSSYQIYLYSGGITSQITNNSSSNARSHINNKGDIVWDSYDGNDREIYLYHNGVTQQITNNGCDDLFPRINDKLEIVWKRVDGNKISICHYYNGTTDIVQSYELQTGEHAASIGAMPVINNSGQIIWTLNRNNKVTINLAKPVNYNAVIPILLLLSE
jgi:hypothetical protein